MSDLVLHVGQTANGVLTFSEVTPPSNGAVTSDNAFVVGTLDADKVTWHFHCVGAAVDGSITVVNVGYTGTSVSPDAGPAQVMPGTISVSMLPVAETGNFNFGSATIT